MLLHYSLYRPQSIHKIVPNRINWFVLTMGLALETSAFASLYYTTRIAARRPARIMFASPPSSHSAHRSLQFWNLEPGNYWLIKDLSQSILNLGQFAVPESAYERFNALAYYSLLGHYSFSWLSGIVWTPIRYVTLSFRERRGAASFAVTGTLRYHNHICVWRVALSGMIFLAAQKLSGTLCLRLWPVSFRLLDVLKVLFDTILSDKLLLG